MSGEQNRNRDLAAMAFIGLLASVAIGTAWIIRSPVGDPNHLVGGYSATPDAAPTLCWFGLVRGPSEVWERLGLDKIDGGDSIALAKSCFRAPKECDVDGGVPESCSTATQVLPMGIEYTPADEWFQPYVPGEPVFEVWVNGHPSAPWRCACGAPGAQDAGVCERFDPIFSKKKEKVTDWEGREYDVYPQLDGGVWTEVPTSETWQMMGPGLHRGNCTPMPCSSWGEPEALPPTCRASECAGRACGMGKGGGRCGPDFSVDDAGQAITCVGNAWTKECDPDWECGPGKWAASCGQCPSGSTCVGHKCKLDKDPEDAGR